MAATMTTTQVEEVKLSPKVAKKLRTLIASYAGIRAEIKALEEAARSELANIEGVRDEVGAKSFAFEGAKITLVEGVNSRLDKKALMEAGVSAAQIERGTITKPKKAYTKVTLPGASDDGE